MTAVPEVVVAQPDEFRLPTTLVAFQLHSISPLLMNNPSAFTADPSTAPKAGGTKIPTPEQEAKAGCYVDAEGLYFPSAAIRNCLLTASKALRGKPSGKGREVSLRPILSGALYTVQDRVRLCDPAGRQLGPDEYEISTMRAVVAGKGAVRRSRPMIRDWSCKITLEYYREYISKELEPIILDALRRGGALVGIGNYRPEKGGPFGRFTAQPIEL